MRTSVGALSYERKRQLEQKEITDHIITPFEQRPRTHRGPRWKFVKQCDRPPDFALPSGVNAYVDEDALYKHVCKELGSDETFESQCTDRWIPLPSIEDYVCTLRDNAQSLGSKFGWLTSAIAFQGLVTIALHHLPPWMMFALANPQPLPE